MNGINHTRCPLAQLTRLILSSRQLLNYVKYSRAIDQYRAGRVGINTSVLEATLFCKFLRVYACRSLTHTLA